jgi:hypothetical protein
MDASKGWVAAKDLLKGDLLRRKDGSVAVVEEVFDTGVEETVYNCSVADYHTYFVGGEDWGFSVWAHNTSCDARLLRKDLDPTGKIAKAGEQAAHIVPTGAFSNRPADIVSGLVEARKIIKDAGIGINTAENGFFALAGHNGTHTNDFFRTLIKGLKDAETTGTVKSYMATLKASLV